MPDRELGDAGPWGHKVTVHIYVEGDMVRATDVSDDACHQLDVPQAEFVGVSIEEVAEKPSEQGAA